MIRVATSRSRFSFNPGEIGRLKPSVFAADKFIQTRSPVSELTSSLPKIPGIMITGRLPLRSFDRAKIASRFGAFLPPGRQPESTTESVRTKAMKAGFFNARTQRRKGAKDFNKFSFILCVFAPLRPGVLIILIVLNFSIY